MTTMKKATMIMLCVMLVVAWFMVACDGEANPEPEDIAAPQQIVGEHSTLSTSDGHIRDDELADYIASKIPKDGNGVPQVKDVKIMFNSCFGGRFADDFERVFGPDGECEGVPWVFGSASGSNELAVGWEDGPETDNGFGSSWTDALAGEKSSPTDPTEGSIRDGTSDNVLDDFETARDNDDAGPNHNDWEHPEVASGNGGASIRWHTQGTKHEAVIFGGKQTDERHHNNVNNVEEALEDVWPDGSRKIQKLDGGTEQDLKNAIDEACSRLDSDTELVLYFDDHGGADLDIDEQNAASMLSPIEITGNFSIDFDLDASWEESLAAMVDQCDDVSPFVILEFAKPIISEEWAISLNDVPIALPTGNLTGELELAVNWTSIQKGTNYLEIAPLPTDPFEALVMVLDNLELSSGPINEIEIKA
jgi:hypothetical protein